MLRQFPIGLASGLVLLAALALTAACGSSEEELPGNAASATATPAPTATASPATATPPPASYATPAATLGEWAMYRDPDGRFAISYPSDWYLDDGADSKVRPSGYLTTHFYSYQPGSITAGAK